MTRNTIIAAALALLLGGVVLGVYAPVTNYPFVTYDDDVRLLRNPAVRSGFSWENAGWAFTHQWNANWSPLTWISHMVDFSLFGSDAGGHHRTNLWLHALNVILLFGALRTATGDPLRSAAAAALLALHPIHVESVAWVSERKGLLSSTFAFASLWCYVAHARSGRTGQRRLSLLFLGLGLMAKSMPVTLPLLFLLLDRWPLRREAPLRQLALEKWPYLAVSAAASAASYLAQQQGGAVPNVAVLPLVPRLANALVSSVLYLRKLVWPVDLAVFYPHPNLPGGTPWNALQVAGAVGVLALLAVAARRSPHPSTRVGLLWYAVSLLPVLGIVQLGSQAMADRYAYLPAVGIYVALVWGAAHLLRDVSPRLRGAAVAIACAGLVVLGVACREQIQVWRSSEALFRHATKVTQGNFQMHFNLANTLKGRGRIEEAIYHYRAALAIHPHMGRAHYNLANTLADEGRVVAAIGEYRLTMRDLPNFQGARDALGRLLIQEGDLPGSLAHYREEAQRRPRSLVAQVTLGHLARMAGEWAEAMRAYQAASDLAPDDVRWPQAIEEVRAESQGAQPAP